MDAETVTAYKLLLTQAEAHQILSMCSEIMNRMSEDSAEFDTARELTDVLNSQLDA